MLLMMIPARAVMLMARALDTGVCAKLMEVTEEAQAGQGHVCEERQHYDEKGFHLFTHAGFECTIRKSLNLNFR